MLANISHATWRVVIIAVLFYITANILKGILLLPQLYLWNAASPTISYIISYTALGVTCYRQYKSADFKTKDYLKNNEKGRNPSTETYGMDRFNTPKHIYFEYYLEYTQGNFFSRFLAQTVAYLSMASSRRTRLEIGRYTETGAESYEKKTRYENKERLVGAKLGAEVSSDQATISRNFLEMEKAGHPTPEVIRNAHKGQRVNAQEEFKTLADMKKREILKKELDEAETLEEVAAIEEKIKELDPEAQELSGDA